MQKENLWKLTESERAAFITAKLRAKQKVAQERFTSLIKDYEQICSESEDANNGVKVDILRESKVIGLTITGINFEIILLF